MTMQRRVRARRAVRRPCHSKNLYISPKKDDTVNAGNMKVQWDPKCVRGGTMDLYLYAQQKQDVVRPIHAWEGLSTEQGSANLSLDPKWWDGDDNIPMNVQIVPSGSPGWETPYPLSNSFTVAKPKGESSGNNIMGNRYVTNFNPNNGQISAGKLAAAVVVPVVVVLALIGGTFYWLHKRKVKREEKHDNQMARFSQYAASSSGMSQVEATQPMSAYDMNPYGYGETQQSMYDQQANDFTTAPAVPEKTMEVEPAAKESNESLGGSSDRPGSDKPASTDSPFDKDSEMLRPHSTKRRGTRARRARLRRAAKRRSGIEPEYWSNGAEEQPPMDTLPSAWEANGRQEPTGQFARLSVQDVGVRPLSRENRMERRRAVELEDAPEPAPAVLYPELKSTVPPTLLQYGDDPELDDPFLEEFEPEPEPEPEPDMPRVSANMLGSHSRAEKVSAYLSQLPQFSQTPDEEISVPSNWRQPSHSGRRNSNADSVFSGRSRRTSVDGTMFHDAFDDAEE